jgi:four helix bundle protein
MKELAHRKLDAYRIAIEFVLVAFGFCEQLPQGHSLFADQLRRASTSICLHIAEGAGEHSRREKGRFYRIAKRSAIECVAILDVCAAIEIAVGTVRGEERLFRIVSMLTKLTIGTEVSPGS